MYRMMYKSAYTSPRIGDSWGCLDKTCAFCIFFYFRLNSSLFSPKIFWPKILLAFAGNSCLHSRISLFSLKIFHSPKIFPKILGKFFFYFRRKFFLRRKYFAENSWIRRQFLLAFPNFFVFAKNSFFFFAENIFAENSWKFFLYFRRNFCVPPKILACIPNFSIFAENSFVIFTENFWKILFLFSPKILGKYFLYFCRTFFLYFRRKFFLRRKYFRRKFLIRRKLLLAFPNFFIVFNNSLFSPKIQARISRIFGKNKENFPR